MVSRSDFQSLASTSLCHALLLVLLWRKYGRLFVTSLLVGLAPAVAFGIADEIQTSRWQATLISVVARQLSFHVEPGPSNAIRFPAAGPYDERLGYGRLEDFVERLEPEGYAISAQARMSPWLLALTDRGLFAPYREKSQSGLELRGCRGEIGRASCRERVFGYV